MEQQWEAKVEGQKLELSWQVTENTYSLHPQKTVVLAFEKKSRKDRRFRMVKLAG